MKFKSFVVFLALIIFPQITFANVFNSPKSLSYIAPKLPQFTEITCKFKQEKKLPNNVILNSSGDFTFNPRTGIVFKTTYPIQSVNSYSPNEYNQINDIINAIVNKRYSKIENQFDFFFVETNPWEFGLRPKKSSQIANHIKTIEIYGNKNISKLIVTTTNSVKTTIWFYE